VPITPDAFSLQWTHAFAANPVMAMNVGVEQYAVGKFDPKATLQGYVNSSIAAQTTHNLLSKSGLGANDIEYLVLAMLGQNSVATVGDIARIGGFTLASYDVPLDPTGVLQLTAPFVGRGRFGGLARVVANYSGVGGSYTPGIWDRGANAASGTLFGAQALLQIFTPTGTAATGSIAIPTQPVAADTVVIGGTTYTWSASPAAANQVLIGATAAASAANLYAAIIGGVGATTTPYFAGTTRPPTTAIYAPPTGASNTINITYATTGVAGNSFTLAKTGTGGLTVSAATLTGGVAGDTYTFAIATATTSGGSYTTVATFTSLGNVLGAEWQTVALNVTLNRYVKLIATPVSGSTNIIGFACAFAPLWGL
jgi:hypothetical protein